jgi:ABC-type dipeptide/oligopeptide/nickel transport system permease subunit
VIGESSAVLEIPVPQEVDDAPAARRPRQSPLLWVGLALIGLLVVMAVFAPWLASYSPTEISGPRLQQPSAEHWLGTDVPGHDIFALLVYGARVSLAVALVGGSVAVVGGIIVGVLPAMLGGPADDISNRLVVFLLALPGIPLLILVSSLAEDYVDVAMFLVIGFLGIAPTARILRGQALTLRRRGYLAAARGFGGGPLYVLRRHLVPAMGPLVIINFVNWAGAAIGAQAGLAFLGLGEPTGVSWGLTLNRALAQPGIYSSPMWVWWVLPVGFAITLALLGFTFVGMAFETRFNPRTLRSI